MSRDSLSGNIELYFVSFYWLYSHFATFFFLHIKSKLFSRATIFYGPPLPVYDLLLKTTYLMSKLLNRSNWNLV